MTEDEEIALYNNPHCDLPFTYLNLVAARIKKLKLTDSYFKLWFRIVMETGTPNTPWKSEGW